MWAWPTLKYRRVPSGRLMESMKFLNRLKKTDPVT